MKILAISDFDSGFSAARIMPKIKRENPDVIIAQGDLCYGDKMRTVLFSNWNEIKVNGKEWYDFVSKKEARILVKKSLEQGERVIKNLASLGVPVFIVYGNHESWDHKSELKEYYRLRFDKIIKKYETVFSLEFTKAEYEGINFIGYGNFNSSPEYERLGILGRIELRNFIRHYRDLFSKTMPNILITHNVPYGTKLDKINNPKSPRDGEHVGSKYARKLISKFKPVLCISGHMHENQGKIKLKRTVCINSGMGSKGQYAIINTKTWRIKLVKL